MRNKNIIISRKLGIMMLLQAQSGRFFSILKAKCPAVAVKLSVDMLNFVLKTKINSLTVEKYVVYC